LLRPTLIAILKTPESSRRVWKWSRLAKVEELLVNERGFFVPFGTALLALCATAALDDNSQRHGKAAHIKSAIIANKQALAQSAWPQISITGCRERSDRSI